MRLPVLEYGRLERTAPGMTPHRWERLRRLDERHARVNGSGTAFDWRFRDFAVAQNRVGVLCVPGLTVEILPKVCSTDEADEAHLATSNLLFMLHVAGEFPVSLPGSADVATQRLPLLDALACAFARSLLQELGRGPDRGYLQREENLRHLRGRILVAEDLRRNVILRHRVFVAHDEFDADTTLNRALKAAARRILRLEVEGARADLTRALEELDAVDDAALRQADLERVSFHRNNVRFRPLFEFARLVLLGASPAPRHGDQESFALLFEMDRLFEAFFAAYVVKHAPQLGLDRRCIHVQARGTSVWLLRRLADDRPMLRLRPDLVIDPHGDFQGAVLDTNWKRLGAGGLLGVGPSQADLYQLAAYASRFGHPDNVLVYPAAAGARPEAYRLIGTTQSLRIAVLPMSYDMRRGPNRTLSSMSVAVGCLSPRPRSQPLRRREKSPDQPISPCDESSFRRDLNSSQDGKSTEEVTATQPNTSAVTRPSSSGTDDRSMSDAT